MQPKLCSSLVFTVVAPSDSVTENPWPLVHAGGGATVWPFLMPVVVPDTVTVLSSD